MKGSEVSLHLKLTGWLASHILQVLTENTGSWGRVKQFITHSTSSGQRVRISVCVWVPRVPIPQG